MTFGYIMYASFVCVSPLMAWVYGLVSVPWDDGHGDRRREGFRHSYEASGMAMDE